MLNVEKLSKKSRTFQRLTGLAPDKFQKLLKKLEPLFKQSKIKRKKRLNIIKKSG